MKQQIIEGLRKKLLLVKIEHFDPVTIIHEKTVSYFGQKLNLIGKLADLTEKQFESWVDTNGITGYYNYVKGAFCCETAKESFFSKPHKEGIYFENQLGKKPHLGMFIEQRGNILEDYDKAFKQWQEAQEKVWNRSNTFLFEII